MIYLFIDDERNPPEHWTEGGSNSVITARTSDAAIWILQQMKDNGHTLDFISFDHDLGGDDTTRLVVNWCIENQFFPRSATVHSMNPIGKEWLEGTINRYFESELIS